MQIRWAEEKDLAILRTYDQHIRADELENRVRQGGVLIAEEQGRFVGWLRYNLFWDNTPFMNMLYLLEPERGKGTGRALVAFWEEQMKKQGYRAVMTSSQADEYAQHFYQHIGYRAIGGFLLPGEAYELIFWKSLEA